jgi:dihydroorotase
MKRFTLAAAVVFALVASVHTQQAAPPYELLLKGGTVIDARNGINAVRDVAIAQGKVAAVAANIPAAQSAKTVNAAGMLVVPGLIDLHAHVYRPTVSLGQFRADNNMVYPDGFSFRNGVTTFVDPGGAGWRNFEDLKDRIIDRSDTRVLAFINIVGRGSAGGRYEQDLTDMEVKPTADMALKYKNLIVGVKSAHYSGPEWAPFERAVEVGKIESIPVMVDFGSARVRTVGELFTRIFRPGDIWTHMYGGSRGEQDPKTLGPSQAFIEGRKKGILFDVGHGGGSFLWRTSVPMTKAGFWPDTISTDLHTRSMNAGVKDILNVMSKFLALGMTVEQVVTANTLNAAKAIKQEQLGNLSVGSVADIAVLRLEKGNFGFIDQAGARLKGTQRLRAELTLREGKVVYDLNGMSADDWDKLPADYRGTGDERWDPYHANRPARAPRPPGQ